MADDEEPTALFPAPSAPSLSQWAVSMDDEPVEDKVASLPAGGAADTPLLSGAAKDAPRAASRAGSAAAERA